VVTRSDYVDTNYHEGVIIAFMRILSVVMSPVIPHWCQHLHEQLINSGFLSKITSILPSTANSIPPLVIDESWPTITVPSCGTDGILEKAKYLLSLSDAIRAQFANYVKMTEKKSKKPDGTVPPTNFVYIRVATGYTEWQQKVIQTCRDHAQQHGAVAFTDQVNGLKVTISNLFEDKKLKTNAMKFMVDLLNDYKACTADSEEDKISSCLSLATPFDEVALWKEYTNFLIRAISPISSTNPDTFTISPIDPANPVDEEGKPLQVQPRPGKPIFVFCSKA